MTNKRVTMQDIANACGLSRNTVSKAFNGRGHVPAATRALILQKAGELGYGLPQGAQASRLLSSGTSIALLTHNMPEDYHVGTYLVTTFTDQVSRSGYTLKMFEISAEERRQRILPPHFNPEQTAGIVGIELFDPDYLKMICSLGLPTVIIDNPPLAGRELMPCDFVTMENVAGLRLLSTSGKIEPSCREAIRQQLIRFYHENDFTRQLTEALCEIVPMLRKYRPR